MCDHHSEGLTMVMVYSCFREFIVRSRITTMPPPSTVSMVLASRLGVTASKSCFKTRQGRLFFLASSAFHLDDKPANKSCHQPGLLAGHTCRTCFPGSCASRCSSSSGCWWRRWRARTGRPGSGSACPFWFSSAAASCVSSDCCRGQWRHMETLCLLLQTRHFGPGDGTYLLNPRSFL